MVNGDNFQLMKPSSFSKIIQFKKDENHLWKKWFSNGEIQLNQIKIEESVRIDLDFEYYNPIIISNCVINSITLEKGTFNKIVKFENCTIHHIRVCADICFNEQFFIINCKIGNLFLDGLYRDDVFIENNVVSRIVETQNPVFENRVFLDSNRFEGEVRFWEGVYRKRLSFYYSIFKGEVSFQGVVFEQGLMIGEEAIFESKLIFNSGEFKSLLFAGGKFEEVIITGGNFREISFSNIEISNKLRLAFFHDLIINEFQIDFSNINCKQFFFDGDKGKINKLVLNGIFSKEMYCEFVGINTPKNIVFDNFTNFGNIYFKDVSYHTVENDGLDFGFLIIKNSDLGKTTFMSSNFSGLYLDFRGSKITEAFVSDTIMPTEIKSEDDNYNSEQRRLGYSQLKKIYESRGDFVTALEYNAKEINALAQSSNVTGFEKFNLCLSRISTNHGTDWARGLLTTLAFASTCFFVLCLNLGINPSFTKYGWNYFSYKSIPAFVEFLNPLHKTKDIVALLKGVKSDDIKLSIGTSVLGILSKVFIAYFEYQLIQAFRKYGKK